MSDPSLTEETNAVLQNLRELNAHLPDELNVDRAIAELETTADAIDRLEVSDR